jgi:tRNA(fMet)-specific endonuclease VapC
MLDTDTCVALLRGQAPRAFQRLRRHRVDDVAISSITLAELRYGAARSARPEYHHDLIARFCAPLVIAAFDAAAAATYGAVRAALERTGKPIGPLDTLIASHALTMGAILVSANEREFRRVKGLVVENWLEA